MIVVKLVSSSQQFVLGEKKQYFLYFQNTFQVMSNYPFVKQNYVSI